MLLPPDALQVRCNVYPKKTIKKLRELGGKKVKENGYKEFVLDPPGNINGSNPVCGTTLRYLVLTT